ncbi:hypothetical protein ACQP1O_16970 [Nocardia sp. CA-151230]|uniref:hypothetical protein n=1 Tax=Nocardia sp. CA-151230 TaxID=3239982 RepID=UPI003D8B8753
MTNQTVANAEPFIDRQISLRFKGDWGGANLHRVCGWLSQELGDRCARGSRFTIANGRGGTDEVHALLAGDVDVAILTPTAAAAGIPAGVGPLAVPGAGQLRALGTVPQIDRLVTCVDAELGVSQMSELADLSSSLRIATSPNDGEHLIGVAAHRLLSAIGIEPRQLEEAGGSFIYTERPMSAIAAFREGVANVLINEAIMLPVWQRITEKKPVTYLDAGAAAIGAFAEWNWPTATVASGYLPTLDRDLTALDYSDFLLVCRADLPDDIAALIAWCMVATRDAIESQYWYIPADQSPITYPLTLRGISTAVIPLHPGAEATYATLDENTRAVNEDQIWLPGSRS